MAKSDIPFHLTEGDKLSGVWKKLHAHLEERLDHLRGKNDASLDPVQTAMLRGQIAEIKRCLNLDNSPVNE